MGLLEKLLLRWQSVVVVGCCRSNTQEYVGIAFGNLLFYVTIVIPILKTARSHPLFRNKTRVDGSNSRTM